MSWLREFFSYVFEPFLWQGALAAVEISTLAVAGGVVLGLGLALARLSNVGVVRGGAWVYIWFVRGTPQLLQLVFLYDALPGFGITLDTFTTAVLGFALNEAAFSAEILRGGILSVNRDQAIAAASLGMGPLLTLRRIILPQAMRAILPGMANDAISMIKGTSIASVIFVNELTFRSQQIVGQNFKFFTVFAAAGLIYLALTSAISLLQALLERRFIIGDQAGWGNGGRAHSIPAWPLADQPPLRRCRARPRRKRRRGPASRSRSDCWPLRLAYLRISTTKTASADRPSSSSCVTSGRRYGSREVFRSVDLQVHRGEVVTIIGPSGSGKSTLLRLINHLEKLDWGEDPGRRAIMLATRNRAINCARSRNLAKARARARIGMVFQHFNLFDHLTALENVCEAPIRVYRRRPANAPAPMR